uniref:Uncharacterized protein n=1 Tax=Aureoumbra lagunensis TaxID=44058 RepID=A0A7S3JYT2_9STRA
MSSRKNRPPQEEEEEAKAYSTLMRTVESLQSDLQETIATCHELRQGKESAEKGYDTARSEVEKLREALRTTRSQLVEATTAKIEADRNTELVVTKWKSQLDERTSELETVQAKLGAPQDLDMLRIEIQEELEIPHQQKISDIEAQLEATQTAYFESKRELERYKAKSEQEIMLQSSAFQGEKERIQNEIEMYREQLNENEKRLAQISTDGPLREARNRAEALAVEIEALKSEIQKRNEEATQARIAASDLVATKTEIALQARAMTDEAELEVHRLTRKLDLLEAQLTQSRASQSAALNEQRRLEIALAEADSTRRKLEDSHRKNLRQVNTALEAARREIAQERDEAHRKKEIDTRKISSLEQALTERKRLDFEATARLDSAVEAVRNEARDNFNCLEQKFLQLEIESGKSIRNKEQELFEATTLIRKLQAQLKIEQARNTRLEIEAEKNLKPRITDIEHQNHQLIAALDESKRNSLQLERTRQAFEINANQCVQFRNQIDSLTNELDAAKRTIAQLKSTHAADLTEFRIALKKDRAATAQALKNQTNALRKQAQDKLQREKKRADAYKDRAVKERERATKARDALARAATSRVDDVAHDLHLSASIGHDPISPAREGGGTYDGDTFHDNFYARTTNTNNFVISNPTSPAS